MSKVILDRLRERLGANVLEVRSFRGDDVARIKPEHWLEAAKIIRDDAECACDYFIDLAGVDHMDEFEDGRFEVYLIAYSTTKKHRVRLSVRLSAEDPRVGSVSSVYAGAAWAEREAYDMYGVTFENHGDLRRILMYDEFVGYPLRKDYPVNKAQPLIEYREGTFDKLGPFLQDEGMPFDRSPKESS